MTPLRSLWPSSLAARAAALSFFSNAILMVLKIVVGLVTGSIAVLSDGVDSAQDMFASGVALISVRIGSRPPDDEHPYGHGRAETIAAAIQAVLITGGGIVIGYSAVNRLLDPPDDIRVNLGLVVMLLAALVNFGVAQYAGHVARETHSPAIASDARHLMTNVVQALLILLGLGLVALTGEVAFDALLALALAGYLFWTAARILWDVTHDVLDVALTDGELDFVRRAILNEPGVKGFHELRTRRTGQVRYIDVHVLVEPEMSVVDSHAITESIDAKIYKRWPNANVLIHIEPYDVEAEMARQRRL